ncbi:DUF4835 family protein [candidate division KSB1 bacterium]|nr:DUF4835 family protein [candidate division KSB1 bacterium]
MYSLKNRTTLTIILMMILSFSVSAQRIEAQVKVTLDGLSQDKQTKLAGFADKIEHYINSYNWSDDPWDTVVYVYFEMAPQDISTGAEERYSSVLMISNTNDIQFSDKRWKFAYQAEEILVHDEAYLHSFTNMVDFYIYLILGGEFDKWGTLGGTVYYEKARHIAEQSKFSLARYIDGWDRRLDLVNLLLSDRHKPFREMVDYYFYGISFIREDNAKARKHCATAVEMLDKILSNEPENEYAKNFIEAHRSEMLEIFRRAKDKTPLRTLRVLDPDNERMYQDALES